METTKVTFKIYGPLLESFDQQLDRLCLKRDAFLNKVLKIEVPRLAKELQGKRQSNAARRFISGELKRLSPHPINVVVEKSVAEMLHETVEATNLVRDAFANRLLIFLRGSPVLLKYLGLPQTTRPSNFDELIDDLSTGPLAAMEEILNDPMYFLRIAAEERFEEGLYELELPEKLLGFTCYLPDSCVPGTPAHQKAAEEAELLLAEMESLAFDVSPLPATKGVKS